MVLRGDASSPGIGSTLTYEWTVEFSDELERSADEVKKLAALKEDIRKGRRVIVLRLVRQNSMLIKTHCL